MTATSLTQAGFLKKSEVFLLFFFMETMVFAILPLSARSEWMSALLLFHAGVTATFLVASWILHRSESGKEYWSVFYVLFVAGMAVLVSTLWHMDLTRLFGFPSDSPQGISMAIFFQSLLRVMVVLILMAVIGAEWRSMYLRKGNLRLGLAVGISGFLVLAAIAFIPMASQAGMANKLVKLLPWILIFVLSNGFAEELLFRGLLLKRYEPFLGKGLSNLLVAAVFTLLHFPVTYVPDLTLFLLGTFLLALVWGILMQKTEGIWGSALFHAGADCIIIFGVFASMQ
jgi:membrane protease YdiL (CAAX protease family)